jgi:hypothetical protein
LVVDLTRSLSPIPPFGAVAARYFERLGRCVEEAIAHGGIRILPAGVMEADTATALHVGIMSPEEGRLLSKRSRHLQVTELAGGIANFVLPLLVLELFHRDCYSATFEF